MKNKDETFLGKVSWKLKIQTWPRHHNEGRRGDIRQHSLPRPQDTIRSHKRIEKFLKALLQAKYNIKEWNNLLQLIS